VGIVDAYADAGQMMACNMMDACALDGVQAFVDGRQSKAGGRGAKAGA
jgi:hypothetical protein